MRRLILAALLALLAGTPADAWLAQKAATTATTQIFLGGSTNALAIGSDRYLAFGSTAANSSSPVEYYISPIAGNITAFKVKVLTALSTGSYTLTIRKNGVSTAASCIIAAGSQFCSGGDWSGSVSVAPGDSLRVLAHPSTGPAPDVTTIVGFSIKFQPTTPNDTVIFGAAVSSTFSNSAVNIVSPFAAGGTGTVAAARRNWRVPVDGTVDKLYIYSTAPGAAASGKAYDYSIYKNGAAFGTPITANVLETATSANDTTHSGSVTAGNDLEFAASPTNTPTASNAALGVRFVPTSCPACYTFGGTLASSSDSATVTQYISPTLAGAFTATATETDVQTVSHAQTVKAVYCSVATAPGAGKSRTFTLRINGADSATTACAITDTNTTNQVTGLSVAVADNDMLSVSDVPSAGSPAATQFGITFLATTP